MLAFGHVPVPYRTVLAHPTMDKVRVQEEEKEQPMDEASKERQQRARYYGKLAVLPTQAPLGPPPLRVSSDSAAVAIPSASSFPSAARFARSSAGGETSHSLPSTLRRSQPIDIPSERRSTGGSTGAAAMWYRREWQAAADDTDGSSGSSSSGDSDAAVDEWCGGGAAVGSQRRTSESFVDDSHLQWSGRCLDDTYWPAHTGERSSAVGQQRVAPRWQQTTQRRGGGYSDDDSGSEGEDDLIAPFPLLPPSYHVDFELH